MGAARRANGGSVVTLADRSAAEARGKGGRGEILAGPLMSHESLIGILLLQAPPDARFEPGHRPMGQALLEPFTAALENDRRLRELRALREAAEADKLSLLSRLGRTELADIDRRRDGRR